MKGLNRLGVKCYVIDAHKIDNIDSIVAHLKSRPGSKLDEKAVKENSFILGNKFDDIWFQELSLVNTI